VRTHRRHGARGQSAETSDCGLRLPRTPLVVVYCISTPHAPRDLLTRLAFRRVGADGVPHGAARPHRARRSAFHAPGRIPRDPDGRGLRSCYIRTRRRGSRFGGATAGRRPGPARRGGPGDRKALGPAARQRWPGLAPPAPPSCCAARAPSRIPAGTRRSARSGRAGSWSMIRGSSSEPTMPATCVVHTRPDEVFRLSLIEPSRAGGPVARRAAAGTPELLGEAGVVAPAGRSGRVRACARGTAGRPRKRRAGLAARRGAARSSATPSSG